ncbi:hypothetical protein BN1051_01919 [Arthrobacter saudimassiliensis]|uniref:PH domain-containing protein n=1 Tax=Arthrobacter saudimassiliensis TaxID=1461584 RepID=A0A078MQI6_9MICC|nr:hypothetical protein BN1051_01919 [Arthrobacter saudimassiliensis]
MSTADGAPAAGFLAASGEERSPWLKVLKTALAWSGAVGAACAVAGLAAAGVSGLGSVAFAWVLIVAFFALSLLVGHLVGRNNPGGAMAMFVVVYGIKVVLFAAVLLFLGRPEWLESGWFLGAAVAATIAWQAGEIRAFSRVRFLLYDDAADASARPGSGREA